MPATTPRYHEVARILHWVIAGLIVVQYVLAQLAEEAVSDLQSLALLANHKSVGMTVFMLAIIRLAWRFTHAAPPLPANMPDWQVRVSRLTHVLLYLLIFALPLSGWLFSSATTYSVSWFNLFVFPDLIGGNEDWADMLEETHEILASVLFVLALLHILAALKHGLFDRDGVLGGMSSWLSLGLFVIAIGAGIAWLSVPAPVTATAARAAEAPAATGTGEEDSGAVTTEDATNTIQPTIDTSLPEWTVDHTRSHIRFTAEQAGAPFTGEWSRWRAEIRFDPAEPAASSAVIHVDAASAVTGDSERDTTLTKAEWFDSAAHPEVIFRSITITPVETGGFQASGTLRIRNSEHPVRLLFTHQRTDGVDIIEGQVELDRIALGLGTGEWTDTSWVGQQVQVAFQVVGGPPA